MSNSRANLTLWIDSLRKLVESGTGGDDENLETQLLCFQGYPGAWVCKQALHWMPLVPVQCVADGSFKTWPLIRG